MYVLKIINKKMHEDRWIREKRELKIYNSFWDDHDNRDHHVDFWRKIYEVNMLSSGQGWVTQEKAMRYLLIRRC